MFPRLVGIVVLTLATPLMGDAQPASVEVKAFWSLLNQRLADAPNGVENEERPGDAALPEHAVKLRFSKVGGGRVGILRRESDHLSADTFELLETKNGVERKIRLNRVSESGFEDAPDGEEARTALGLSLVVDEALDTDATYRLRIKGSKITFDVDGAPVTLEERTIDSIGGDLAMDKAFRESRSLANGLEVSGGNAGGTSSAQLKYRIDSFEIVEHQWLHLDLDAKADFNIDGSEDDEFFDSLVGGLTLNHARLFDFGILDKARYAEVGLNSRIEADQELDNVDWVVGAVAAVYTEDVLSKWLLRRFGAAPKEANVSPLLSLGYDFVSEISEDDEQGEDVDTHGGSHRAKAALDWSMPLARRLDARALPVGGAIYNIDAIFAVGTMYDFDEAKFFDQTKVGVELTPIVDGTLRPAITLAWQQGEAPPVFDHVDAFLAGLKLLF